VKTVLDEGISLFRLHQNRHGRVEPSKGSYAKEWARWEQRLRVTLFGNADYLNSIQVTVSHIDQSSSIFCSGIIMVVECYRR